MGVLGQLAHPILVAPKLKEIFDYRREKLIEMFGEFHENPNPDATLKQDILA
jgi:hypothetical protein